MTIPCLKSQHDRILIDETSKLYMVVLQEVMKSLAELENQLDDLDGWGQLLIKDCVETDGEVVQHRVNELRYKRKLARNF